MNDSNTVLDQDARKTGIGGNTYLTMDGLVKHCITAPLLELPVDFKEWYKPAHCNSGQSQLPLGLAC